MISFANPLYLLIVPVLLIILLLLRISRREKKLYIPSILLWRNMKGFNQAPFSTFRHFRNLLLILQFVILIAGAIALSAPSFISTTRSPGRNIVFIIDASASMQSTYQGRTRFDYARSKAIELLRSLHAGDRAAVLRIDSAPDIVLPFTDDLRQAENAISGMRARDEPGDTNAVLALAERICAPHDRSSVVVFTDNPVPSDDMDTVAFKLMQEVFADQRPNAGITNMSLRESPVSPGTYYTNIDVYVTPDWSDTVRIRFSMNNRILAEEELSIQPGEVTTVTRKIEASPGTEFQASLIVIDALAVDNDAFAVIPRLPRPKVLLITNGNFFLEKALSVLSDFDIYVTSSADIRSPYDILLYDGVQRISPIPAAGIIEFSRPDEEAAKLEASSLAPVQDWDKKHPILRGIDLGSVQIAQSNVENPMLFGSANVIARTAQSPALTATGNGMRILRFHFDITRSTLILHPVFPMLLSNSLWWSYAGMVPDHRSTYRTGEHIVIPVEAFERQVTLVSTGNERLTGTIENHMLNVPPIHATGIYSAGSGKTDTPVVLALNLFSIDESRMPSQSLSPVHESSDLNIPGESGDIQTDIRSIYPIWPYFILIAVCALLLEWWIVTRRWTA